MNIVNIRKDGTIVKDLSKIKIPDEIVSNVTYIVKQNSKGKSESNDTGIVKI